MDEVLNIKGSNSTKFVSTARASYTHDSKFDKNRLSLDKLGSN